MILKKNLLLLLVHRKVRKIDKTCQMDEMAEKQLVQLKPEGRENLETLTSKGDLSAKTYRRALVFLELDRGKTYTTVSKTIQVTIPTLSGWAGQYRKKDCRCYTTSHAHWIPS
jgi:hypothetical protein